MALALLLANQQAILTQPHQVIAEQLTELIATTKQLKKQVRELIAAPVESVLRALKLLAALFYGLETPSQPILQFYQGVALEFSESTGNDLANSLGLAVIAMRAYFQLTSGDISAIRKTLKTCKSYDTDKILVDSRMLSVGLANLSAVEMQRGRHYKAFKNAHRALQIFTQGASPGKQQKSHASSDDVVLQINILYLLFQAIEGMLDNQPIGHQLKQDYINFQSKYYWEGYELALKHLGHQSKFTALYVRYRPKGIEEHSSCRRKKALPIVVRSRENTSSGEGTIKGILSSLESRITPRFDEIRQMIEDYRPNMDNARVEPKYDLAKQTVLTELKQNSENDTVFTLKLLTSKTKKGLGKLHITIQVRTRLIAEELIEENMLQLLLSQICSDDVKPLSVDLSSCTPQQILRFFVAPFVGIDANRLSVYPKPLSLLPDRKISFLETECLTFVNYVSDATMRLCIAPLEECYSLYVDLEVSEELALTFLSEGYFRTSMSADIFNMYMHCAGEQFQPKQSSPSLAIEEPKLHNSLIFQKELACILERLEGFITEHKLNEGANKKKINIFTSPDIYIKAKLLEIGKSVLYGVKNLPWIKTIDTIVENVYFTYGPEGLVKAKGYASYDHSRLQKDFGVASWSSLKPFEQRQVLALLSNRCSLQVFEQPLKESQMKRYGQNCIKEVNYEKKVFVRNYFMEDYTVPITICIVSLNLQVPVGVRITAYDILQLSETGMFITIQPDMWLRPLSDKLKAADVKKPTDKVAMVTSKEQFRTNYVLAQVLQGGGFEVLSRLIQCERVNGSLALSYAGVNGIRWLRLEDILSWQEFKQILKLG